jgi:polyphosphate glucokinase
MIIDGSMQPMELAHLPYRKGTYEDYVGLRGLVRYGKKKWKKYVFDVVEQLSAALEPDDIVLGGGNVKLLKSLPAKCREGDNANAFIGGFRLWEGPDTLARHTATHPVSLGTRHTAARKSAKKKNKGHGS